MSDIDELLDRVRGSTGPDRELDIAFWLMFDPESADKYSAGKVPLPWLWNVTESIDAALALVERVLPGTASERTAWRGHYRCTLIETNEEGWQNGGKHFRIEATSQASEPLAILTALLQALNSGAKE